MTRRTFDEITRSLTSDEGLPCKGVLQFHYFNPNGLVARKRKNDARIARLVDLGLAQAGALVAHGSGDDYHTRRLAKMVEGSRFERIKTQVLIEGLERTVERQENFIKEVQGPGVKLDGGVAHLGDSVGFKSDVEQYGVLVKVSGQTLTLLVWDSEAGEDYQANQPASRCWFEG